MLEQSWLNQVLGRDAGFSDSTHFGEQATMRSVVQGFLDNEAGFSDEDIVRFINAALQNEAGDIRQGRAEGLETAKVWRVCSTQALSDLNPVGAREAARKHDAMIQAMSERYDIGRAGFGDALHTAWRSTKVPLAPETRAWVIVLDHDGYLSESMGINTVVTFGANPVLSQMRPRLVDFSREAEVLKPSQDAPSATACARRESV